MIVTSVNPKMLPLKFNEKIPFIHKQKVLALTRNFEVPFEDIFQCSKYHQFLFSGVKLKSNLPKFVSEDDDRLCQMLLISL